MIASAKGMKEERAKLLTDCQKMLEEAKGELSDETRGKFDEMFDRAAKLEADIQRTEKLAEASRALEDVRETTLKHDHDKQARTTKDVVTDRDRDLAFRGFALQGTARQRPEFEQAMQKVGAAQYTREASGLLLPEPPRSVQEVRDRYKEQMELRATTNYMNTGTATEGTELVPNEAMAAYEIYLVTFGAVRNVAEIFRRRTGGTLPVPIINDTATTTLGAVLAENTATTVHTIATYNVNLDPYKYTSHLIPVSIELMQDSGQPLGPIIGRAAGIRIGRAQNRDFTVGTGAAGPTGFNTLSSNSTYAAGTGSTGSTHSQWVYSEILTLFHSVDPAYRMQPNCVWMFNDNSLGELKQLTDAGSRPIWHFDMASGGPLTIEGKRYVLNMDMVDMSTATGSSARHPIAFGDFNSVKVAECMEVTLRRLDERYAEQGAVAFLAFARADASPTNTNAIKRWVPAST